MKTPSRYKTSETIAREIEEKSQRSAKPILVAFRNRYGVELNPADAERPVGIFEGDSRTSIGTWLSAADALGYRWADHLEKAGAQWFIPVLQDLALGKPMDDALLEKVKREASERLNGAAMSSAG